MSINKTVKTLFIVGVLFLMGCSQDLQEEINDADREVINYIKDHDVSNGVYFAKTKSYFAGIKGEFLSFQFPVIMVFPENSSKENTLTITNPVVYDGIDEYPCKLEFQDVNSDVNFAPAIATISLDGLDEGKYNFSSLSVTLNGVGKIFSLGDFFVHVFDDDTVISVNNAIDNKGLMFQNTLIFQDGVMLNYDFELINSSDYTILLSSMETSANFFKTQLPIASSDDTFETENSIIKLDKEDRSYYRFYFENVIENNHDFISITPIIVVDLFNNHQNKILMNQMNYWPFLTHEIIIDTITS